MEVKIKRLNENAVLPQKATELSIGYDLYVPNDVRIEHERQVIPLGFAIELPPCIEAKIEPRSGFSSKGIEGFLTGYSKEPQYMQRFDADVLVGKIDPDYRGEVGVIIRNNDPQREFLISQGTRIAQMTFYKTMDLDVVEAEELSDTARGVGGFGSTGAK